MKQANETIIAKECRFATYCPPPDGSDKDLHVIKEIVHYDNGRVEPRLKFEYEVPRKFWVTMKGRRDYKERKEYESLENLIEYETTQHNLLRDVKKALGMPWSHGTLRDISASPYLYGTDITSTALIKKAYKDKYPNAATPYNVAVFDTETDVVRGTGEIIMASLTHRERVFLCIRNIAVEGYGDVERQIHEKFQQYLSEEIKERNLTLEIEFVDTEVDLIKACFARAHAWKPDFVAIWNISFDVEKMLAACAKENVEPKDIFSDPTVPEPYRFFKYKKGKTKKVTASGKEMPIKPAAQWHTVTVPASFFFIDAMSAYKQIRVGSPEERSYALDYILGQNKIRRKLKFEFAKDKEGLAWHIEMQMHHMLDYAIYNIFDCICIELLDEKTSDLRSAMPMLAGCADFGSFNSQPQRLATEFHFYCLEQGKVFGVTSNELRTDLDKYVVSPKDLIVTLPAHLVADNGLPILEGFPELKSNLRAHTWDLDVSAAYPNGEIAFNISRATTRKELSKVDGVTDYDKRMCGINLSGGHVNAGYICNRLFKMPTFDALLGAFERDMADATPPGN